MVTVWCIVTAVCLCRAMETPHIDLTLIPPGRVTDKINLDIRCGIVNNRAVAQQMKTSVYLNEVCPDSLLYYSLITLPPNGSKELRVDLSTAGLVGDNNVVFIVSTSDGEYQINKVFTVVPSDIRSTRLIDGAFVGLYHWSEEEGKHWNRDIRQVTCDQWREIIRSMHDVGMDIVVLQELFRNQAYVGKHSITTENYSGRAFYPSNLYSGRMDISCADPVEVILSECDALGMHVMMGVGMFAWFDFTDESLKWHEMVCRELWDMYGHHPSFYAFYISEECAGNLYNNETEPAMQQKRKVEIANFFREYKQYTSSFAPAKPVMLATNSMGLLQGADGYPALLENLDILCPFGFARMPEEDLMGKEAADMLQGFCDKAGSHLWFDLEAFLFNPDQSLSPRPIKEIVSDLQMFENFEKVICYQYPGVFNDPRMSVRIGEKNTVDLYKKYKVYREKVLKKKKSGDEIMK